MNNSSAFKEDEPNILNELVNKFLPHYKFFIVLLALSIAGYFTYLFLVSPKYMISASILMKDEKKGADDSKILESLNIYSSSKIVENEIEIIKSRTLMSEVVESLGLYAPVFKDGKYKTSPAYHTSPVKIAVKDVNELDRGDLPVNIPFVYDAKKNVVLLKNKMYELDKWVVTPYGTLSFQRDSSAKNWQGQDFSFSLLSPKKLANQLIGNLDATSANRLSTIVNLYYIDEVPKRGEDILNRLIEVYNKVTIRQKNSFASNTLAFIDERLKYVGNELSQVEKQVQQYKANKGVVNLSQQGSLYLQNVGDADQKLANIKIQSEILNEVEQFVNSSSGSTGIIPSTLGVQDPVLSNLLEKLYNAESNYNRLKKTVPENNPILSSLEGEIEKIRPTILANIRVQKIGLNTSRVNLTSTNQKYTSILEGIPQKERGLLEINRQQSVLSNVYAFLLQKREETELSYSSLVGDSRTVDSALSFNKPVSPKKLLVFMSFLGVFMGLGIGTVLFKDFINQKVVSRSQIESATQIPVLSEILHVKGKRGIFIDKKKDVVVYHQFKQLKTALGLFKKDVANRILITSSISGEGKSFISANLAIATAASGKKTLLLDCDFRNPFISKSFGEYNKIGLMEYLEGTVDAYKIIRATKFDNLFVVGAGTLLSEDAAEKISNGRLEELFLYLHEIFDVILIDAPPVGPVSDAYILSQFCDKSIFVVRHAYTPKTIISSLRKNEKIRALKVSCIVYNDVKVDSFTNNLSDYGYNYKYFKRLDDFRT